MSSLRIQVFKGDSQIRKTNVKVPLGVARIALRVMPPRVAELLGKEGIALAELAGALDKEGVTGTIAEVARQGETIVISIA